MATGDVEPLRGRDVLVAMGVVLAVMGVAVASDPGARSALVSQPAVREVLCADDLRVEVLTSHPENRLVAPEGGLAVRVRLGSEDVPALLELHRRDAGGDWRLAWQLDAPQGREVFYVAGVAPGTEVYVLAKPAGGDLCPARSPVLAAPG